VTKYAAGQLTPRHDHRTIEGNAEVFRRNVHEPASFVSTRIFPLTVPAILSADPYWSGWCRKTRFTPTVNEVFASPSYKS
jgi:hypothetical protein